MNRITARVADSAADAPTLAVVPRRAPSQAKLPLPDPPERPFVALARESRVGGPVRKLVYLVVASFCPVMTKGWKAIGKVRRETIRAACELGKLDTLDQHLRRLRDDGYVTWRRTRGASEFEVSLSPLRVLEATKRPPLKGSQDSPSQGESRPVPENQESPSQGESRPVPENQESPSQGESRPVPENQESPSQGESRPVPENQESPSQGESESPSQGESRVPLSGGVEVAIEVGSEVTTAAAAAAHSSKDPRQVTDKQVKLLLVCADRLKAVAEPELWRAATCETIQRQICAAIDARAEKPRHKHAVAAEVLTGSGEDGGILYRDVVQRCRCGAVRSVSLNRSGAEFDRSDGWRLCGEIAQFLDTSRRERADVFTLSGAGVPLTGWHDGSFTWSDVVIRVEEQNG